MNINIIAVGKIKEKYIRDGIEEYSKRLKTYVKLNIVQCSEEKAPENLRENERQLILSREGEKILSKIDERDYCIALCIEGKSLDSLQFAEKIGEIFDSGNSTITIVIGGSLGLHEEVLKRANYKLSFSKMTYPHQLIRLILLEQVYRAFRIINNHPYHK